jgi:hypothetical protein
MASGCAELPPLHSGSAAQLVAEFPESRINTTKHNSNRVNAYRSIAGARITTNTKDLSRLALLLVRSLALAPPPLPPRAATPNRKPEGPLSLLWLRRQTQGLATRTTSASGETNSKRPAGMLVNGDAMSARGVG